MKTVPQKKKNIRSVKFELLYPLLMAMLVGPFFIFYNFMNNKLIFITAMIALYLFIGWRSIIAVNAVAKSVKVLKKSLRDISEGSGDLTNRLPVVSKDDLGELSRYFNHFQEGLAQMISEIKKTSGNLSDVSIELIKHMKSTAASIIDINMNVESVKQRTLEQSNSVSESTKAVNLIINHLDLLNEVIERQKIGVEDSTTVIKELVNNINSVTANVERMDLEYGKLLNAARSGNFLLEAAVEEVDIMLTISRRLENANELIATIAEQTNILSMNAAIEAAHAGNAGRGFAVVADEIGKLADTASEQSKGISVDVEKISEKIISTVGHIKQVNASYGSVISKIEDISNLEEIIKLSMKEQSLGTGRIHNSLNLIQDITAEVITGAEKMKSSTTAVQNEINKLLDSSSQIENSIIEIALESEAVLNASSLVMDLTGRNREGIDSVLKQIDRFKV